MTPTPEEPMTEREVLARIIDPEAFAEPTSSNLLARELGRLDRQKVAALTKADEYLSRQSSRVRELEGALRLFRDRSESFFDCTDLSQTGTKAIWKSGQLKEALEKAASLLSGGSCSGEVGDDDRDTFARLTEDGHCDDDDCSICNGPAPPSTTGGGS